MTKDIFHERFTKIPYVGMIVASDKNGIIGKGDTIPWMGNPDFLPDIESFRFHTQNAVCVVGRKTFTNLPLLDMKSFENRSFLVLTKDNSTRNKLEYINTGFGIINNNDYFNRKMPNISVYDSIYGIDLIFAKIKKAGFDVMIIGGRTVYEKLIRFVDYILWTSIHRSYEGDVLFPFKEEELIKEHNFEKKSYYADKHLDINLFSRKNVFQPEEDKTIE